MSDHFRPQTRMGITYDPLFVTSLAQYLDEQATHAASQELVQAATGLRRSATGLLLYRDALVAHAAANPPPVETKQTGTALGNLQ